MNTICFHILPENWWYIGSINAHIASTAMKQTTSRRFVKQTRNHEVRIRVSWQRSLLYHLAGPLLTNIVMPWTPDMQRQQKTTSIMRVRSSSSRLKTFHFMSVYACICMYVHAARDCSLSKCLRPFFFSFLFSFFSRNSSRISWLQCCTWAINDVMLRGWHDGELMSQSPSVRGVKGWVHITAARVILKICTLWDQLTRVDRFSTTIDTLQQQVQQQSTIRPNEIKARIPVMYSISSSIFCRWICISILTFRHSAHSRTRSIIYGPFAVWVRSTWPYTPHTPHTAHFFCVTAWFWTSQCLERAEHARKSSFSSFYLLVCNCPLTKCSFRTWTDPNEGKINDTTLISMAQSNWQR